MTKPNSPLIFIHTNSSMDECGWEYGTIFDSILKLVAAYFQEASIALRSDFGFESRRVKMGIVGCW